MRGFYRTIFAWLLLTVLSVATVGCHSSRKTVKGSAVVSSRKIDYKEMRDEVNSRSYDIPAIGRLIEEAALWLGVPYRYAGNDKSGVDCSGLTSQVFLKTLNVKMPRSSREQQQWCKDIKKSDLLPGDLVFFATGSDHNRVSHVGLYIGNGDIIHASSSRGVIVSNLAETYYMLRYHSSGRPEAVHNLYSSAQKKKNNKSTVTSTTPTTVPSEAPTNVPASSIAPTDPAQISLEQLIEHQLDSIAASISPAIPSSISPANPSTLTPTSTTNHTTSPTPTSTSTHFPSHHSTPQTEPSDTIFTQFFD